MTSAFRKAAWAALEAPSADDLVTVVIGPVRYPYTRAGLKRLLIEDRRRSRG